MRFKDTDWDMMEEVLFQRGGRGRARSEVHPCQHAPQDGKARQTRVEAAQGDLKRPHARGNHNGKDERHVHRHVVLSKGNPQALPQAYRAPMHQRSSETGVVTDSN